jgi:hypothetical protein
MSSRASISLNGGLSSGSELHMSDSSARPCAVCVCGVHVCVCVCVCVCVYVYVCRYQCVRVQVHACKYVRLTESQRAHANARDEHPRNSKHNDGL